MKWAAGWAAGTHSLVTVVVIVASKLIYYVAERPELESIYSVGVPPVAAISDVMGPTGLVLMVVAVSAGVLTGLNGFFTAASRVLLPLVAPTWSLVG